MNLATGGKDSKLTCSESIRLTSPEFDMIYDYFVHTVKYLDFFGPQMALAYQLDANSQSQKSLDFQDPTPLPLALVMNAARIKRITHGAV
jgi:hypothetical protein